MRDELNLVLMELMEEDKSIYFLSMDGGESTFSSLKKRFPERYINAGVSEQAIIGMASGMALEKLKPYVYSITPFILERPFEQVKLDIVQQRANVKLFGYWNYPTAGPTHLTKNPKGLCEILGIKFIQPENSAETREKIFEEYEKNGPVFFSLRKNGGKK